MNNRVVKLAFASVIAVAVRIILEFVIPASNLNDLMLYVEPSVLSQSGYFPIVFMIYAWFGYFMIALLSFKLADLISCHPGKIISWIALLWIVYLLEPMPQVDFSNFFKENFFVAFKYQLADSLSLLTLAILVGMIYKKHSQTSKVSKSSSNKPQNLILFFVFYFIVVTCLRFLLDRMEWTWGLNHQTLIYLFWIFIVCLLNFFIYLYLSGGRKQLYWLPALQLLLFNILYFNFFVLLIVKVGPLGLALRGLADYLPLLGLKLFWESRLT